MSYNGIHDVIFDFNVLSELESSGIKYYLVYLKYTAFFSLKATMKFEAKPFC